MIMPLDAIECLDLSPECEGPVEYHTVGDSLKAWPRCSHHADKRQNSYENSLERYASSDVAPSWFDPADAGERWDEDY